MRVNPKDPITAEVFNNLDSHIGLLNETDAVGTKTAKISLIKDEDFNALAENYNKAAIYNTYPINSDGKKNSCCQKGMSCMTQESGRPSLQPCNQTAPCQKNQ